VTTGGGDGKGKDPKSQKGKSSRKKGDVEREARNAKNVVVKTKTKKTTEAVTKRVEGPQARGDQGSKGIQAKEKKRQPNTGSGPLKERVGQCKNDSYPTNITTTGKTQRES